MKLIFGEKLNIAFIILTITGLALISTAQKLSGDSMKMEKGKEIIELAQKEIYRQVKKDSVKSFSIKRSGTSFSNISMEKLSDSMSLETTERKHFETELLVQSPDKIKHFILSYKSNETPAQNSIQVENILNGEKLFRNVQTIINGKIQNLDNLLNSQFVPDNLKEQIKTSLSGSNISSKELAQKSLYLDIFPVFFSLPWATTQQFAYIGKAESGENRADIVELISQDDHRLQFYVDEKTHRLLMLTDEKKSGDDNNEAKTTYFFSDYKLIDGLIIATKINIESTISVIRDLDLGNKKNPTRSKTKTVSEIIIKEFKINPIFKPETFSVKEK